MCMLYRRMVYNIYRNIALFKKVLTKCVSSFFSVSIHSMYTHKNNGPSSLSPQWLCGNSCTWSHEDMKNIFNIYNKYCRPSDDWVTPI